MGWELGAGDCLLPGEADPAGCAWKLTLTLTSYNSCFSWPPEAVTKNRALTVSSSAQ